MPNTLTQAVLSTKTVTVLNANTYSAVFSGIDFSAATTDNTLEGPIALALDVTNDRSFDMYIGVTIARLDGIINVSDRLHIGFVRAGERQVITSASVPQLAYLVGTITSITVTLYGLFELPQINVSTLVSIRILPASSVFAPQPYIGRDMSAEEPGFHRESAVNNQSCAPGLNIGGASLLLPINLAPPAVFYRMRIRRITVVLPPTAYPGDLRATFNIIDKFTSGSEIVLGRSLSTEYASFSYETPLIISNSAIITNASVQVQIDNLNTTRTYLVDSSVEGELIF